jgi:hypothetical protein
MVVKIKLKDTTTPVYYYGVLSHFLEGNTLALLFEDNVVRNFPLFGIMRLSKTGLKLKLQRRLKTNL